MRNPLIPLGAVLLLLSAFAMPLVGHAQNGLGNGGDPRPRRSGRPAPRSEDGRALLGSTAEEKGVWLPDNPFIPNALGFPAQTDLPFQPWARALHASRRTNPLEPHTRCKPSGGPRVFLTPYGDSNGLYVAERSKQGFLVREQGGGTSRLKFAYRVVAKRKHANVERFRKVKLPVAPKIPKSLPRPEVEVTPRKAKKPAVAKLAKR